MYFVSNLCFHFYFCENQSWTLSWLQKYTSTKLWNQKYFDILYTDNILNMHAVFSNLIVHSKPWEENALLMNTTPWCLPKSFVKHCSKKKSLSLKFGIHVVPLKPLTYYLQAYLTHTIKFVIGSKGKATFSKIDWPWMFQHT